jgi:hypothetical protein
MPSCVNPVQFAILGFAQRTDGLRDESKIHLPLCRNLAIPMRAAYHIMRSLVRRNLRVPNGGDVVRKIEFEFPGVERGGRVVLDGDVGLKTADPIAVEFIFDGGIERGRRRGNNKQCEQRARGEEKNQRAFHGVNPLSPTGPRRCESDICGKGFAEASTCGASTYLISLYEQETKNGHSPIGQCPF